MGKTLIVVESPKKTESYRKYLGPGYTVLASKGHVIDLPLSKKQGGSGGLGVDKKTFKPKYETMPDKRETVAAIVAAAKQSDMVLLMTDPDREGEAISWHLSRELPKGTPYKRAATASITKQGITDAIKNAGEINMRMVDSYETRRILDRLAGYETSFLVQQATGGASAGRVQSAALRVLADREKEIRAFKPVEYWPVEAVLETKDKKKVRATVIVPDKMDTKTEADAKAVAKEVGDYLLKVATYDTTRKESKAFPPFTTSQLQGRASSMFGWSQDRTMKCAQSLYEAGHITYMRTDSTHIVPEQIKAIRDVVTGEWGANYLPERPNLYAAGKNAQEAHEAIRPTNLSNKSVTTGDEQKLYSLIWKRTVASQMKPEVREQVRATFRGRPQSTLTLAASGSRQLFDGWKACWDYSDPTDTFLPPMTVGDSVTVGDVKYEQKFTEPPPRYGVATFNTKLEELGIARPSTLATVTKTLTARGYIEPTKGSHHVTDLGLRVVDFLVQSDFCFVDTHFTKDMEDKLDDILESKAEKLDVLTEFWGRLQKDLKNAGSKKAAAARSEHKCPECDKAGREAFLVQKFSRFGPFFSCENRADKAIKCEYTAIVGKQGEPITKVKKVLNESKHSCPNCQKLLIIRENSKGEYLGCRNWTNPKCKGFYAPDGTKQEPSAKKPFRKWGKKKK